MEHHFCKRTSLRESLLAESARDYQIGQTNEFAIQKHELDMIETSIEIIVAIKWQWGNVSVVSGVCVRNKGSESRLCLSLSLPFSPSLQLRHSLCKILSPFLPSFLSLSPFLPVSWGGSACWRLAEWTVMFSVTHILSFNSLPHVSMSLHHPKTKATLLNLWSTTSVCSLPWVK